MDKIFCTVCNTEAACHADGSVACSCSVVNDPQDDQIPASWNATMEEVYAIQLAESDYAKND